MQAVVCVGGGGAVSKYEQRNAAMFYLWRIFLRRQHLPRHFSSPLSSRPRNTGCRRPRCKQTQRSEEVARPEIICVCVIIQPTILNFVLSMPM